MMRCINFDGQFERYATEWMRQNAAQFHNNVDAMEAKMPDVYLQWLNEPGRLAGRRHAGRVFSAL